MKFEIDEVWESRDGEKWVISEILSTGNYPVAATNLLHNYAILYTKCGLEVPNLESDFDLITFLGYKINFPEYFL